MSKSLIPPFNCIHPTTNTHSRQVCSMACTTQLIVLSNATLLSLFSDRNSHPTRNAVAHQIELQGVREFPGDVRPYAAWPVLHEELGKLVKGKRVAMEVSPQDAVPYLDWVPHGVVQLIEHLGGEVVSSSQLVSAFGPS